jgi:hypothetical protein
VRSAANADSQWPDEASGRYVFLRSSVGNVRRLAAQSDVPLFHGDAPGSLEVAAHQHVAITEAQPPSPERPAS